MPTEEKKVSVSIPGNGPSKPLGPILSEVGEDIKRAYSVGRDKIINSAFKKIPDPNDGKSVPIWGDWLMDETLKDARL